MCSSNIFLGFSKILLTMSISLLFSFNISKNCSILLVVLSISYIESGDNEFSVDDDTCDTVDDACGTIYDDGYM